MLGRSRNILLLAALSATALLGSAVATAEPFSSPGTTPSTTTTTVVATTSSGTWFDIDAAIYEYEAKLAAEREAARVEAERVAAEEAAHAAFLAQITPSVDYWLRMHQCEQADSWSAYGRFGNGLMGGGGLGLSDGAWRDWGGQEFAPTAAGATPEQQMIVASRGYRRYGASPWGCRV